MFLSIEHDYHDKASLAAHDDWFVYCELPVFVTFAAKIDKQVSVQLATEKNLEKFLVNQLFYPNANPKPNIIAWIRSLTNRTGRFLYLSPSCR